MGEFFLFILMFVVFFAWLHHKTKGFACYEDSQGCQGYCEQIDSENLGSYLYDPGDPGSYFYDFQDTFPLIKDD